MTIFIFCNNRIITETYEHRTMAFFISGGITSSTFLYNQSCCDVSFIFKYFRIFVAPHSSKIRFFFVVLTSLKEKEGIEEFVYKNIFQKVGIFTNRKCATTTYYIIFSIEFSLIISCRFPQIISGSHHPQ